MSKRSLTVKGKSIVIDRLTLASHTKESTHYQKLPHQVDPTQVDTTLNANLQNMSLNCSKLIITSRNSKQLELK